MKVGKSTAAILSGLVLASSLAGMASAQAPAPKAERALGVEATIPFANSIGIRDYRADGDHAIWIQGSGRQWYRAELMGPCMGLNFANRVGFVTRGTSSLDKFSQIQVEGRTCQISSLVTSAPPPSKADKAKAPEA